MSTSQNDLYSICLGLEGFWYSRKRTEFVFLHNLGRLQPIEVNGALTLSVALRA
jgi:hypothetical protein